jgi:hypothetical protein
MTETADRAGEPDGRTEAAWDERQQECCKQRNVGDVDPAMHPCASAPDLAHLIGPWPGSALFRLAWSLTTLPGDCPRAEPIKNSATLLGALARRFE